MTASSLTHINAPDEWHCIDFLADLHLQEQDATWKGFVHYLQNSPADAIFLLGDILELWAGDDALHHPEHAFERLFVQTLHCISQTKTLYFMAGNRDFLVGKEFCRAAGLVYLNDPCVLQIPASEKTEEVPETRILLSHGDALCIADVQYIQFRQQVRNPAWQQGFLQQPLEQRLALARQLRQQSGQRKNDLGVEGYADVDEPLAVQWLKDHQCTWLIHGHTHKPKDHTLPNNMRRSVLSDWDLEEIAQPRAEVLRLQRNQKELRWNRIDCVS